MIWWELVNTRQSGVGGLRMTSESQWSPLAYSSRHVSILDARSWIGRRKEVGDRDVPSNERKPSSKAGRVLRELPQALIRSKTEWWTVIRIMRFTSVGALPAGFC